ncbi:MAG: hypothetical protein JWO38_8219 [Gemmataceae bacterium]|nr:hypothetical protein [Gemmataceae bacterium]
MDTRDQISALVERLLAEGPIGMSAAARLYGTYRDGRPTHPSTPTRHHMQGVTLPDGTLVRLEAVRISGRLMTSRAAVARFIAAQQSWAAPQVVRAARTPAARSRAADAAAAELDAAGF